LFRSGGFHPPGEGEIDILRVIEVAVKEGDIITESAWIFGRRRGRRRGGDGNLLELGQDLGSQQQVFRTVGLPNPLDLDLIGGEIGVDDLLEGRIRGSPDLRPTHEAVVFCLVVVQAGFDADEPVGHKENGILGIEGHPAQIGEPGLDPGVTPLSHLEGQHPLFPVDVVGLVEGYPDDDAGGNPQGT